MTILRFALFGLLALSFGCGGKKSSEESKVVPAPPATIDAANAAEVQPAEAPEKAIPEGQWFRATLDFGDLGEMPFFLLLPEGKSGTAYFKNDTELAEATFEWDGDTVTFEFFWGYVSILRGVKNEDGSLKGEWTRDTPLWGKVVRTFNASPIDSPDPQTRFTGEPTEMSVAGVWNIQFEEHGEGIGVFTQTGDVVSGYVRPGSLGDMRFLSGNVRDGQLRLSTFNGNSANLLLAKGTTKKLEGMISMQNVWNEPFTATKADDDFMPENKVKITSKSGRVSLPELEAYKGKPVVVILFATWCSSCNDATPFMIKLEQEFRDEGVKFHSIAFDLTEDQDVTAREIATFKKKYSVPWTISQHPTTIERWAEDMPPEIKGWDGLPITLFIDSQGKVQTAFGGWFGPAAPEVSADLKEKFREWTAAIVEES